MKLAADAVETLEEFQATTERARKVILDALSDMRPTAPAEGCPENEVDAAESEETLQGPQERQEEDESQLEPQAISSEFAVSHAVDEASPSLGDFGTV